jgi:putative phosphoesterase
MTAPGSTSSANSTRQPVLTIGVVTDTHIPDKVTELHPGIVPALRSAGVSHILHAGDICSRRVLKTLAEVAPVTAVRGNRDLFAGPLSLVEQVEFGGVQVALMHGHGGWKKYLWDKWKFMLVGYRLERYLYLLSQAGPQAKAVVFGHTHHPAIFWHEGRLLFNPGSACAGYLNGDPPTIGLLHVYPDQQVNAEILPLTGWKIKERRWINR